MTDAPPAKKRRHNRLMLLVLAAIGFVPLIASYFLYFSVRDEDPWATTNEGTLVVGMPPVDRYALTRPASGQPFATDGLWWLLIAATDGCEEACTEAVHQLRQVHILLNEDADRLARAFVFVEPPAELAGLESRYPEMAMYRRGDGVLKDGIYIVDPIGNLVLFYAFDQAGAPVLEDLEQLLEVSQIG